MNSAFKALADPTRREILALLRNGDLNAGAIAARFRISAASISHHLKELTTAGLVLRERQGQHIIYSLNITVFEEVIAWIQGIKNRE